MLTNAAPPEDIGDLFIELGGGLAHVASLPRQASVREHIL
jgi:hypothetical protein